MMTDGVIGGGLSAAGGALGGLNRMADGTLKAQLRFGRHPSVHKLSLNMWGEKYHSRQYFTNFCQPNFLQNETSALYKFTHPTLGSVCTYESLSNLSCGQMCEILT